MLLFHFAPLCILNVKKAALPFRNGAHEGGDSSVCEVEHFGTDISIGGVVQSVGWKTYTKTKKEKLVKKLGFCFQFYIPKHITIILELKDYFFLSILCRKHTKCIHIVFFKVANFPRMEIQGVTLENYEINLQKK